MVGGLLRRTYSWLVQRPERMGSVLLLASLPNILDQMFKNDIGAEDVFITGFSFPAGWLGAYLLRTFTYEDDRHPRTRISDFSKRKKIRKELEKIDFESLIEKEHIALERASSLKSFFNERKMPIEPNTEKGVDKLAALAEKTRDPLLYERAIEIYFSQDRFDEGLIQVDKLIQLQKEKNQALPFFSEPDWHLNVFLYRLLARLQPRDPSPLLHSAVLQITKHRYADALYYSTFAKRTAEFFNSSIKKEILCIDALLHRSINSKDSENVWTYFIKEIKKEPALDRIAETKNPVRALKDSHFLSKTVLFKDKAIKEDLEAEKDMTLKINEIICDDYGTAEPLYLTEEPIDGMHTYIMRHEDGETLLEQFKQKEYSNLKYVVDCLAQIHAKIPQEDVRKGELSIARKLRKKLLAKDLGLDHKLAKKIVNNYRPVYDTFKDAIYVYNKDAHPENWLINENKIIAIDCENEFLVPMQFDLVNLLEYSDCVSDEQKDIAIKQYVRAYNKHSSRCVELNQFRFIYFNAVINRAISLCTAWSSKDRQSMHSERANVIDNAIHAISRLRLEFKDYHFIHAKKYDALSESLKDIKELVSVERDH